YLLKIPVPVLKELLRKYKSVIQFVVLFLGAYLVLSGLYAFYLKASLNANYPPDYLTNLVARQSASLLEAFGYGVTLEYNSLRKGMFVILDNKYAVNIVEGCNAVSVIILFISFVISFAEKF